MRNVDTKQKNAAHVLHSFCFIGKTACGALLN